MMENEQKCELCKFWVDERIMNEGKCQRYPPTVMIGITSRTIHDDRQGYITVPSSCTGSVFPTTKENDWCGEFLLKNTIEH